MKKENRNRKLLKYIDLRDSIGIEYGALSNPIVRKSDGNIIYADYTSTDELLKKSIDDKNVNSNLMVMVDINLSLPDSKEKLLSYGPIDYILASHVFEHLPNPLTWLEENTALIKAGGIISLAIPDKQYTFD